MSSATLAHSPIKGFDVGCVCDIRVSLHESVQLLGEDGKSQKGGAGLSRSAQRNKKKREKKAGEGRDGDDQESTADAVADQVQAVQIDEAEIPGEAGKKIRTLQKKLRQIEEIKKKAANAGGEGALPPAQREKLGQEAALREELEELHKSL